VDLRVLGPFEAVSDGQPLPLGARKQRAVLAMLTLEANRPVSADRLVEGLWGESPPATAGKMVQLYVSQLRKLLRGQEIAITTRGRAYELTCPSDAVDLTRAERLVEAAAAGASADGKARKALALWRGPPLADLADEPFAAAEIRRCDELWLQAKELAIDADLAAGRHEDALREVLPLAAEHPLQERVQGQLMLALYRSGRQTEALEAYRVTRARLVDEIGSEPGPELRALHEQILHQSPELAGPVRARPATAARGSPPADRRSRRRAGVAVALAAGLAAVVAVGLLLTGGSKTIEPESVALIDPGSGDVQETYGVGHGPTAVVRGGGSTWVANGLDGTVTRINRARGERVTISVGGAPGALAYGAGSVWVGGDGRDVIQIDPRRNRVVGRFDVGGHPTGLAVGYGALWIAEPREGVVVRRDLAGRRRPERLAAGAGPSALAIGAGAVWVAAEDSGQLVRLAPDSGLATSATNVGNGPSAVAVGEGAVWVANRPDGTISRVDPRTGAVAGAQTVGTEAASIAIAGGSVWVADPAGQRLVRVDPRSGKVTGKLPISTPGGLAGGGSLWAAAGATDTGHRGGRLLVESFGCGPDCLDPAAGYSQAYESLTLVYDGLLGYPHRPGAAGEALVSALATSVPKPSDGGRTYVFTLRPGIRFSDGRPVRPADVRASLQRAVVLSARTLPGFFDAIPGARACVAAPDSCDLSRAIATDDGARTVTFRLRRPDPTFPYRLASVTASIVPAGTPAAAGLQPPLGTGPYRFKSVDGDGNSTLVRNPRFHTWSATARPDGLVDTIVVRRRGDLTQQQGIDAVEKGESDITRLDYAGPRLSPARRSGVATSYPSRIATSPSLGADFMFLNVREPPFDDVDVRRAVNLATDRSRIVALWGGSEAAQPACQLVPPSIPGARPYCPYTTRPSAAGTWVGPDLAAAKRLIAASGTRGMKVRVWTDVTKVRFGRYFVGLLGDLGYVSSLKVVGAGLDYERAAFDPRNHAQIGMSGWGADYPTPATFFDPRFSCAGLAAPASQNLAHFCSPALDREAAAAAAAEGPASEAAWARATRHLTDVAPAVPLDHRQISYFTSERLGNVVQNPMLGVMLERAWVR
jgi:ABC-type transport system substrate-binding protein/DNA-binding SARP family transcriptional activator